MVQRRQVEKQLAEIDRLLASTATNATRQAAATLFDLCDERDPTVVQHAGTALRAIADRNPSVLVASLNDPRLATRLQVANVLRTKLGDELKLIRGAAPPPAKSRFSPGNSVLKKRRAGGEACLWFAAGTHMSGQPAPSAGQPGLIWWA